MINSTTASLFLFLVLLCGTATASDSNIIGFKAVHYSVIHQKQHSDYPHSHLLPSPFDTGIGFGMFADRVIVENMLDFELSVSWISMDDALDSKIIPIDLLFKRTFHTKSPIELYVGLGPALSVVVNHHGADLFAGLSSIVGCYSWINDKVGIDLELDYNLINEFGPTHEIGMAGGLIFSI